MSKEFNVKHGLTVADRLIADDKSTFTDTYFKNLRNTYKKILSIDDGNTDPFNLCIFGDSVADDKTQFITPHIQGSLGARGAALGGFWIGGLPFTNMTTISGAVHVNNGTTVPYEYEYWLTGITTVLEPGAEVQYESYNTGNADLPTDTYGVVYVMDVDGGTFDVKVDGVTEISNVDTSSVSLSGGYVSHVEGTVAHRVVNVKNTHPTNDVRLIGTVFDNTTVSGVVAVGIAKGGLALSESNQTDINIITPIFDVLSTDLMITEMKEDYTNVEQHIEAHMDIFKSVLPNTDRLIIGTSPRQVDDNDMISNKVFRSKCIEQNYDYWDGYTPLVDWDTIDALGWGGDGIHLSEDASKYVADLIWRDLGKLFFEGLRSKIRSTTSGVLLGDIELNVASGEFATAEGGSTIASGNNSHAEGANTTAAGDNSHAEGTNTTTHSGAQNAHVEGVGTFCQGFASHAEGIRCLARNQGAHAEGVDASALGYAGHAEGHESKVDWGGANAHAEGYKTTAKGSANHTEGANTRSNGYASHAEGNATSAYGNASHAGGQNAKALNNNTFVWSDGTNFRDSGGHTFSVFASGGVHLSGGGLYVNGQQLTPGGGASLSNVVDEATGSTTGVRLGDVTNNVASGNFSISEGRNTSSLGHYSHSEGDGTTIGQYVLGGHAEGIGSVILSDGYGTRGAHVEGVQCTALKGYGSHAEGLQTVADGYSSHAEGAETLTQGSCAHAEGFRTTSSGTYAHSEGESTKALGKNSHAEGLSTTSSGGNSHSEGSSTKALGNNSHAAGANATANNHNTFVWSDGTVFGDTQTKTFNVMATNGVHLSGGLFVDGVEVDPNASGGGVTVSGTPSSGQITSFVDANTIKGESGLSITSNVLKIGSGSTAGILSTSLLSSATSSSSSNGGIVAGMGYGAGSYIKTTSDSAGVSIGYAGYGGHILTSGYANIAIGSAIDSSSEVKSYGGVGGGSGYGGSFSLGSAINGGKILSDSTNGGGAFSLGSANGAGSQIKANEAGAVASGYATGGSTIVASGKGSHAEGYADSQSILSSGKGAHAEGSGTTASGYYAHAEGLSTVASGNHSHAEGAYTTALYEQSHAEGYYTTAFNVHSHVEGWSSIANAQGSHAEGRSCSSNGDYSHVEGLNSTSGDIASHSEGQNTFSYGVGSHSEGYNTSTYNIGSHSEGQGTYAYGNASHAEGHYCVANAEYTHAQGSRATANLFGQHSQAAGMFANTGDAQFTRVILRESTTDATPTVLATPTALTLDGNRAHAYTITIVAKQASSGNAGMFKRMCLVSENSGTVAIQGALQTIGTDIDTISVGAISISIFSGALRISVTGVAATNINWVATVETTEVGID